ncbi:MAG: hypothetical protein COA57_14765 [Flavobacteriales bacterium]|nr:MAG: hypothetical protein COA57_14765 [Flavobacteriales bacterium]
MITLDSRRKEFIFHAVFWIAFLMVSTTLTVEIFGVEDIFLRVSSITATFALLVYLNFYILTPKLFFNGRHGWFALSIIAAIVFISIVRVEMDIFFIGDTHILSAEFRSISHYVFVAITYTLILFVTSSFKFMRESYEKSQLEQELKHYKLEAELKFLKAQVNPHFLFNSLNNIYSLNQVNPEKSSEMILKLSDMMRYMLYESNDRKVPLEKEIEYLRNYIDLQQLRSRERQNVKLEVEGDSTNVMIEPMFFVPLLENSFKHGNAMDTDNGWIDCKLTVKNGEVNFEVTNSTTTTQQRKDKVGGVGLENIKKRLQLLYPCKHCIATSKESDIFTSSVKIELA